MKQSCRPILIRVLLFGGILSSLLLLYAASAPIEISQPVSDGARVEIRAGTETGQSFIAHFPGLNRISLQATRLPAGSIDDLHFRLLTGQPGEEWPLLETINVEVEHKHGWIHFRFPPQHYETRRRYIFYVGSDSAQAITLKAHSKDVYPEGTRLDRPGDLVFEAGFQPSAEKTITIMLSRLTANKPGLAGAGWFYALLLISMLTVQSLVLEKLIAEHVLRGKNQVDQTTEGTR